MANGHVCPDIDRSPIGESYRQKTLLYRNLGNGRKQIADVVSGGSYYSQSAFTLYFCVGKADKIDRVEVRWPTGEKQSWQAVAVNRTLLITEGREQLVEKPFREVLRQVSRSFSPAEANV